MDDAVMQRVILRRERDDAPSASETTQRLDHAGAVILDQKPASLLIEGDEATLKRAMGAAPGWTAVPMRRYPVPDTRMKIQR